MECLTDGMGCQRGGALARWQPRSGSALNFDSRSSTGTRPAVSAVFSHVFDGVGGLVCFEAGCDARCARGRLSLSSFLRAPRSVDAKGCKPMLDCPHSPASSLPLHTNSLAAPHLACGYT
jgi:hypothetical protein